MLDTVVHTGSAPITALVRPRVPVETRRLAFARASAHLALGGLPVLGISAQVLGWIQLHTLTVYVVLPLLAVVALLVTVAPNPIDTLVATAVGWGLLACAAYDAFRLPTIYIAHWWGDFFGSVGGWAVSGHGTNFAVGYLWRYLGDGGGIAVPFFVAMSLLPAAAVPTLRRAIALGIAYGVCPVWSGLVLTDALSGQKLFPLTVRTAVLSLVGHLIYGAVLGIGLWCSRTARSDLVAAAGSSGGWQPGGNAR